MIQQDFDQDYEVDSSLYVDDIRTQAKESLLSFFRNRRFWGGGSISQAKLLSDQVLRVVLSAKLDVAIDVAYRAMQASPPENWNLTQALWDVKLINSFLAKCSTFGIPKHFAGGILLVFLEQCHGVTEVIRRWEKFVYYLEQMRKKLAEEEVIQVKKVGRYD